MDRERRRGAKRRRSPGSFLSGLDELLCSRPIYETPDSSTDNVGETAGAEQPEPLPRFPSPSSADASQAKQKSSEGRKLSSTPSSASACLLLESFDSSTDVLGGGSELELLNRKEEETADMVSFLTRALVKVPSVENLCELMQFAAHAGVDETLAALKHAGLLERCISLLFRIIADMPGCPSEQRSGSLFHVALLSFLSLLAKRCDLEVLCHTSIVKALVDQLISSQPDPPVREVLESSRNEVTVTRGDADAVVNQQPQRHWADVRRKASPLRRPLATSVSTSGYAAGEARLRAVWTLLRPSGTDARELVADTNSGFSLALKLLLDLVFRQNQLGGELAEGTCVAKLFARYEGLSLLATKLDMCTTEAPEHAVMVQDVLSFLEVVTASVRLSEESTLETVTQSLVQLLFRLEETSLPSAAEAPSSKTLVTLRVLTNITGLSPRFLPPNERRVLGRLLRRFILRGTGAGTATALCAETSTVLAPDTEELEVFSLCCAVNVVKWETKQRCCEFTSAMIDGEEEQSNAPTSHALLQRAAAAMMAGYGKGGVENMVRSGYYALFLGVVSLAYDPAREDESLRVPVMTAVVSAATCDGSLSKPTAAKPMKVVVAIVQEFLLFQSASGTLTRDALVEMNEIVNSLVQANCLDVTAE